METYTVPNRMLQLQPLKLMDTDKAEQTQYDLYHEQHVVGNKVEKKGKKSCSSSQRTIHLQINRERARPIPTTDFQVS